MNPPVAGSRAAFPKIEILQMRLPLRMVRPVVLSLVILSCAENPVGLAVPRTIRADVIPGATGLIITEIMPDPAKVSDASGEWFEVYNAGSEAVDLGGLKIVSASGLNNSESHTIPATANVVVDPGEYAVLGNNANVNTNGGVFEAYSYGASIALNNGSTTSANEWLAIRKLTPSATGTDSVTLDSVAYAVRPPGGTPGPYSPPSGSSRGVISLADDNTIISGSNWVTSVTTYGLGDKGTPGQPNVGGPAATVSVRISWVTPGTTFRVTASAVDADGKPSATNFTWQSDAPSIATINPSSGVATGVSLGIATLTATASNGVTGTAPLFVVSTGDVASISISINDPSQVPVGFTKPAFPTTRTTAGAIVTPTLVWSSSDDAIATVSDLGYITGAAPGKVSIRATAPNGVYGEVPFTVIPADAPTTAIYRNHVEFGTPTDATPGDELILAKRQYVESYNKDRGGPNWVSWNLNATQFSGVPRCDCFSADQTLPADVYHVVDFDYRNGGYDRGHMVQSESRTTTDQENASTFLLTNILPQGAENNQGPWSKFENYLNDLARGTAADPTKHEIYVIAGGLYGSNPGSLKEEGKVFIPDYTWKIAVIMAEGKGLSDVHSTADLQVIAVEMPNLTTPGGPASSVGIRNNAWEQYQVNVDQVEQETGYDFLSNLPAQIETLVEANDRAPVAKWDGETAGSEGSAVSFDGSASTDPDASDVLAYEWDFGDGTTGSGVAPTHVFADNGVYDVLLTVKDRAGAEDSQSNFVTISNVAPSVVISPAPVINSGGTYNLSGGFGDLGQVDGPWSYVIDWGDGTTPGSTSMQGALTGSHSYQAAGLYSITLTVTDKDGGRGSASTTLRVNRIEASMSLNPNKINIRSSGNGQIIASIFGNASFDGAAIDGASVRIGQVSPDTNGNDGEKLSVFDANQDGILDLVVHFNRDELISAGALGTSTREMVLQGKLNDGRQFEARAAVVVGP
jgi:DNA/RNA endonuclease G (NUC1)/PKD repeat protein